MAFSANRKVDTRSLRAKVLSSLQAGDIQAAIRECETTSGPIASIMLTGLRSYQQLLERGERAETMRMLVGEAMSGYISQALGQVNKRNDVLTTIAMAAPLLGMTGTVTGMINSFAGLAQSATGAGGGAIVANGIAEALITTAAGLLIALAVVIPQSLFNRWSDEIELEMEEVTSVLSDFILTHN